jgi:lipoprotein-releasing system permease protein
MRSRARDLFDHRSPWFLIPLFVLGWSSALVLVPDAPPWVGRVGQAGLVASFGLLTWWAIAGFSGYEHRAGARIIRRPRAPRPLGPAGWATVAIAVGGGLAMVLGARSAPLAMVVATATLAAIVWVLIRRFTVFATLSIVGITIGVAALIVVQSVATGFQHEFERRVLGVYAHINVTQSFGIVEYRRFEAYLRGVDGVVGASPFVYYAMALAPTGKRAAADDDIRRASVLVKGIDPSTAHEVIDLEEHLRGQIEDSVSIDALTSDIVLEPQPDRRDAHLPSVIVETPDPRGEDWYPPAMRKWRDLPSDRKYGRKTASLDDDDWPDDVESEVPPGDLDDLPTMFVGVTLARELSLHVGDVVMLVDPGPSWDHSAAPEFRRYRIAGVFRAGFQEYDTRLVYVHIKELQYFKYRGKDKVSGVDLRLADPYEAPAVEAVLRTTIGDGEYSILEWQKLNANLFQSIRTQKSILTIILSLVSTVAGFNVLAALWTMVVRRTPEVAILMSMGATESGVARIFQFTGVMLGAVGCVAGLVFGLVLCGLVELYGYSLDPEVYFIERLPVELSLTQIAAVVALTIGIAFVATIPPSLRAAKLRPVEGLRYE